MVVILPPPHVPAGVVPDNVERGDAQHGDSGNAMCIQLPFLTRLGPEGGTEPGSKASADVGGVWIKFPLMIGLLLSMAENKFKLMMMDTNTVTSLLLVNS